MATGKPLTVQLLRIQIAKVRLTWEAIRRNSLRNGHRNFVSIGVEPGDLLGEGTLKEVKTQFRRRSRSNVLASKPVQPILVLVL